MSIEVYPVTAERWDDVVKVFGRRGQDPSWCWCQRFMHSPVATSPAPANGPDNRGALRQEISEAAVPPGLLAYVAGQPVGWTRVGARSGLAGVGGNRALARVLAEDLSEPDDYGVWWVTCFAVESQHRRSGVGSALLVAAVDYARQHGATAVEGHPVDATALSAARVAGSAIFTGTVSMFVAAGFTEVARTYRTRPVMRLRLHGSD